MVQDAVTDGVGAYHAGVDLLLLGNVVHTGTDRALVISVTQLLLVLKSL